MAGDVYPDEEGLVVLLRNEIDALRAELASTKEEIEYTERAVLDLTRALASTREERDREAVNGDRLAEFVTLSFPQMQRAGSELLNNHAQVVAARSSQPEPGDSRWAQTVRPDSRPLTYEMLAAFGPDAVPAGRADLRCTGDDYCLIEEAEDCGMFPELCRHQPAGRAEPGPDMKADIGKCDCGCGTPIGSDDDVIYDDEGYCYLEDCWNP